MKTEESHFGWGLSETLWQDLVVFFSTSIRPAASLLLPTSKIATGIRTGSTFWSAIVLISLKAWLFQVFNCHNHPVFGKEKLCKQILWDRFTMAI